MSQLLFVRHAQASFLQPEYDKLSPLGETQARMLGQYWAAQRLVFHRAASGPRVRQKQTAKIVGDTYALDGVSFPQATVIPEFDEFDGEGLLRCALPSLLESNQQVRHLYSSFANSCRETRARSFQRFFEVLVSEWVSGNPCFAGVESWAAFCSRVNSGISRFVSECGRGTTAVIFCSGGPTAIAVQRALHLAPADALRVMWTCRNCSTTEFLFSARGFTLSAFNAVAHLADPALRTYW